MQVCKTRAVGVDPEDRAILRTAANPRRPIKRVARYNQSGLWISPIAAVTETMQVRKGLRCHPTVRYQAKAGYQRGQEE